MKVLAINASPRGMLGCTERILQPLLEGMRQSGAETEIVYLANKKIHSCIGCFTCWFKTPGICGLKDDMGLLLKKLVDADFIIYGTPLYFFTMSGLLKIFFERNLPLALPFMEKSQSGMTMHLMRYPNKSKKCLLVSPSGFPELIHFNVLVATIKKIVAESGYEYMGAILRPTAALMDHLESQPIIKNYFDSLREAGQ